MFGKGENLVATDYQMVRHPDIHQAQCLYQTFRDKAVCLAGCDFTGRVIVRQHHGSGIVVQGAFNHFPGMDFRAVDGAGEEGFTGNQLILVIQIQHPEFFTLQSRHVQNQPFPCRTGGGEGHAGFMKMAVQSFQGPQNETALAGRHLSGQKGKLLHCASLHSVDDAHNGAAFRMLHGVIPQPVIMDRHGITLRTTGMMTVRHQTGSNAGSFRTHFSAVRVYDPAVQRPLRQTRTRKPFPESLPRDEKRLLPAAPCCPNCGGSLSYLGEDTAEQLELMRSAFRVIRTVREKHACTQCDAIVQAPAPSRPIERGIAGPGLLARVLTSKYAEHTPLYRQSEIYGRQGVELSRSLLSGWVDACCRLLSPLEEALHGYVMTDGKLHADDTPVQVLLPGNKKTKTGRLWAYVRDDRNAGSALAPAVRFAYSPDRKGIHPQTHLACFSGVLQADAYAGFNELYRNGGITEAACWAHARRKIHDMHVRIPSALTEEALEQIGQLYAIEADIRGMPAEQRLAERQRKTKPLLKSLESWLREKMKTLFFGSGHGGERGALLYSLIGTCKLNDVDPESYLRHVPGVIADWPVNRVSELLPWRIALPAE
ncbi:transposase [Escherichia coli]|nr:transposase [Escherichia coli]